jgi:hypothetical protein
MPSFISDEEADKFFADEKPATGKRPGFISDEEAEQFFKEPPPAPLTVPERVGAQVRKRVGETAQGIGHLISAQVRPSKLLTGEGRLEGAPIEEEVAALIPGGRAGMQLAKGLTDAQMEQFWKAKNAAEAGQYSEAVLRGIAGAVPIVGPMAMGYAERLKQGEDLPELGADVAFDIATARLAGPALRGAAAGAQAAPGVATKGVRTIATAAKTPVGKLAIKAATAPIRAAVAPVMSVIETGKGIRDLYRAVGAGAPKEATAALSRPVGASSSWQPGAAFPQIAMPPQGPLAQMLTETPAFKARMPAAAVESPAVEAATKACMANPESCGLAALEGSSGELAMMLAQTPFAEAQKLPVAVRRLTEFKASPPPIPPPAEAVAERTAKLAASKATSQELAAMLGQAESPVAAPIPKAVRKPRAKKPTPPKIEGPRPLGRYLDPGQHLKDLMDISGANTERVLELIEGIPNPAERAAIMERLGLLEATP